MRPVRPAKIPARPTVQRRRRAVRLATAGLAALALAWGLPPFQLVGSHEARAQSAEASPAGTPGSGAYGARKPKPDGLPPLPTLVGQYDVEELRRLLEVAKESGFSDEQLQEITVEDEHGNVVNAWEFLAAYDRRKKAEDERRAAERAKVYLAPKDVFKELNEKQRKDLDHLRDTLIFVD